MTRLRAWTIGVAGCGMAAGLGVVGIGGASASGPSDPATAVLVTGSYGTRAVPAAPAGDHGSAVDLAVGATKRGSAARLGLAAPTVYESLVASGAGAEEACEFARGYDPRGCVSAATWAARHREERTASERRAARIYDTVCVDIDTHKGDGHKTSHACNIRSFTSRHGANWYLLNKMKQTARVTHGGVLDDLDRIGVRAQYQTGNKTVDWSPVGDVDRGTCQSSTSTVTDPRSGVSYSNTSTVCPDTWGPYAARRFRWFGGRWKGLRGDNEYVGTNASSIVHSPPRASAGYRLTAFIHWT